MASFVIKGLRKSAVLLFLAGLTAAQEHSSAPVLVQFDPIQTTVAIAIPTDLRVVVDEVCKQTETTCEGTQYLAGSAVAPMNLQGAWNSVIDQLLEGSGINYVASPPTVASGGRLIIQPRTAGTTQGPTQSPEVQVGARNAREATSLSRSVDQSNPDGSASSGPAPESSSGSTGEENNAASGSSAPYAANAPSVAGSPLTSNIPAGSQSGLEGASYLPFPDSHGNPIPTTNEPVLYLPFPDSHGNPIPVQPSDPGGSPFPVEVIRQANAH